MHTLYGLDRNELNKLAQSFRRMGVKYPYAFAKDLYYFLQMSGENGSGERSNPWVQNFSIEDEAVFSNLRLLKQKNWMGGYNAKGIEAGYNWGKFLKSLDKSSENLTRYKIDFLNKQVAMLNDEINRLSRYL